MAQDLDAAAKHYKNFCEALGIDLTKPDTVDTPYRVTRMFASEFLAGCKDACFNFTCFPVLEEQRDQLVVQAGIRYVSLCAHHHLPIVGHAHVCYLPNKKLAGLSKLARAVKWVAAKPTVQESLLGDVREYLVRMLEPRFLGVSMSGRHECMSCRGVRESASLAINNTFYVNPECKGDKGESLFKQDYDTTKQEFFRAIDHWFKYQQIQ